MSLTLVTAPEQEPITLEQAKQQLRLEIDDDDELIRSYIVAARQWIEGQLKRAIHSQTWDYTIDWNWPVRFGRHYIRLPLNPVSSISSITYVDSDGSGQTLASSQYTAVTRRYGSYIVEAYDIEWPDVRCVPEAITIRMVVGNDDEVPEAIKRATALLVSHWYENRCGVEAKTMMPVPFGVDALISPYQGGSV